MHYLGAAHCLFQISGVNVPVKSTTPRVPLTLKSLSPALVAMGGAASGRSSSDPSGSKANRHTGGIDVVHDPPGSAAGGGLHEDALGGRTPALPACRSMLRAAALASDAGLGPGLTCEIFSVP